jgi:hypothetical protein
LIQDERLPKIDGGSKEVPMRKIAALALLLVVAGTALAAEKVTWKEERSGYQFRLSPKTGEVQVAFYLFLDYESVPPCINVQVDWSIYGSQTASQVLLAEEKQPDSRDCCGCYASMSTLSPFVVVSPGANYSAMVVVRDLENGLTFEKTIRYIAPLSLPTGIALKVKTPSGSTDEIDLSSVSSADLDRLAAYWTSFGNDYVLTASDVAIGDFLSKYASSRTSFPASVLLVASVTTEVTTAGKPITLTASYDRILFVYPVVSLDAIGGLREQLARFPDEFVGRVLTRKGPPKEGSALTVFVDDVAWSILSAASAEKAKRKN